MFISVAIFLNQQDVRQEIHIQNPARWFHLNYFNAFSFYGCILRIGLHDYQHKCKSYVFKSNELTVAPAGPIPPGSPGKPGEPCKKKKIVLIIIVSCMVITCYKELQNNPVEVIKKEINTHWSVWKYRG